MSTLKNISDLTEKPKMSVYDSFKQVRYWIIRFVSVPVPMLKSSVPIIGGKTMIEMFALVLLFGICLAISVQTGSGSIPDWMGAILVVFGMRNNLLTLLFGISYERALYWHKAVAFATIGSMICHGISEGNNTTGVVVAILMGVAILLYFLVKPYFSFEFFYFLHIACYLAMVPVLFIHKATYFPLSIIVWAIDVILRYVITLKKVEMQATLLPGRIVKLSMPKTFAYSPGQYCFLQVKGLSAVEYHPFSISTSPLQDDITFHIRPLGDWTDGLLNLIDAKLTAQQKSVAEGVEMSETGETSIVPGKQSVGSLLSVPLEVCIEGPFGMPRINLEDEGYTVFLLISGGIGVTPLQGVCNHLAMQQQKGRKLRKVIFVWSVKDYSDGSISLDKSVLIHAERLTKNRDPETSLPKSFQPPMRSASDVRARGLTNDTLPSVDANATAVGGANGRVKKGAAAAAVIPSSTPYENIESGESPASAVTDELSIQSELIFHTEYHLTTGKKAAEGDSIRDDVHPDDAKYVHYGRPDLKAIFANTKALCQTDVISRVAVFVCGPQSLVDNVTDLCRVENMRCGCDAVRFDCHEELFNF